MRRQSTDGLIVNPSHRSTRPDFPDRFGSIEDTRVHRQQFFRWYNTVHRHSGIALMTPEAVHYGKAATCTQRRAVTLDAAFATNPIRFKGRAPKPLELPTAAWIKPPKKDAIPTAPHPVAF